MGACAVSGMFDKARRWARGMKRDIAALWIAGRDPRTPLVAKMLTLAVVAYALSPIDLIPDFVPVLGYLDDLLIVPLGVMLAIRLVPATLMAEFREQASGVPRRPSSRAGLVFIVSVWALSAGWLMWWVYR